jgi:hypothetical protein
MMLLIPRFCLVLLVCMVAACTAMAQVRRAAAQEEAEFGPVVRAYLSYLRAEQEVVDDRASRHEVSPAYYRRNSNRIRALRQMALRLARATRNDYLPELEAVARDEMRTLFDDPPDPESLKVDTVIDQTFRYLGSVQSGETFYLFARLDPYEQAELKKKEEKAQKSVGARPLTNPGPARAHGEAPDRPRSAQIP